MVVTPTCRYEHGQLTRVRNSEGGVQWGFVTPDRTGDMFLGHIYTCVVCGYTEFFDNEPALTKLAAGIK